MTTVRRLLLVLGWACVLVAVVLGTLFLAPDTQTSSRYPAMASAFIPWAAVAWAGALLFFLGGARGGLRALLAVGATGALLVQLALLRNYWPHPAPEASGTRVRVAMLNTHDGKAEPSSAARVLREADADVVVLVEVSDPFVQSSEVARLLTAYPHRVGSTAPGWARAGSESPAHTLVASRLPLTAVERLPSAMEQHVVRVDTGGAPITLIAVHPLNMVTGAHLWVAEGEVVRAAAARHRGEPLALVGDFNATPEQVPLRALLDDGLSLGSAQAGAGWQPTFDNLIGWLPPVVALDHVVTNEHVVTTSFRTAEVDRTDHTAIIADLVVR